jgi:hypothetical protein
MAWVASSEPLVARLRASAWPVLDLTVRGSLAVLDGADEATRPLHD